MYAYILDFLYSDYRKVYTPNIERGLAVSLINVLAFVKGEPELFVLSDALQHETPKNATSHAMLYVRRKHLS